MAEKILNARQEKFCQLYASREEYFCNGVKSYMEAYSTNGKKVGYMAAKANAYKLLTNTDILNRIDELLELNGLNNSYVDKQLEKLITQDADFKAKLGAIKEYNELKKRILKKLEIAPSDGFSINIKKVSDGDNMDSNEEAGDSVGSSTEQGNE